MSINGPQIVTPTGKLLMGEYTRHTFSYTVPEGDPDAGTILSMILENEETVHVMRQDKMKAEKTPEVEVWQRCKPVA